MAHNPSEILSLLFLPSVLPSVWENPSNKIVRFLVSPSIDSMLFLWALLSWAGQKGTRRFTTLNTYKHATPQEEGKASLLADTLKRYSAFHLSRFCIHFLKSSSPTSAFLDTAGITKKWNLRRKLHHPLSLPTKRVLVLTLLFEHTAFSSLKAPSIPKANIHRLTGQSFDV